MICNNCPRNCNIDREKYVGFCKQSNILKIAHINPHFGEEPPISGTNGSCTVFFSGCTLGCVFCQNYQISHKGVGDYTNVEEVSIKIKNIYNEKKVHNVNFVTPDQFFFETTQIIESLKNFGITIPTVYNTSGYQKISSLKMIENTADIYLPDYKYSDDDLGKRLSKVNSYSSIALDAIYEMVKQKGFINSLSAENTATKGVLIRHLVLPGYIKNSTNALLSLFLEFGKELPISIMGQFTPHQHFEDENLNRYLSKEEYDEVIDYALSLGFKNLLIQELNQNNDFLPDFNCKNPFKGNIK